METVRPKCLFQYKDALECQLCLHDVWCTSADTCNSNRYLSLDNKLFRMLLTGAYTRADLIHYLCQVHKNTERTAITAIRQALKKTGVYFSLQNQPGSPLRARLDSADLQLWATQMIKRIIPERFHAKEGFYKIYNNEVPKVIDCHRAFVVVTDPNCKKRIFDELIKKPFSKVGWQIPWTHGHFWELLNS